MQVNGGEGLPKWYEDCFRTALRRVATVLNSSDEYSLAKGVPLEASDLAVDAAFLSRSLDQYLVQFNVALVDPQTSGDEYSAEYFFYCDVDFPVRGGSQRSRVAKFIVPEPFLAWGFRRLHRPPGSAEQLLLSDFGEDWGHPEFLPSCAVNYLVKNFWHNFVHRVVQGITSHNYHQFRGAAREDSDFQADNLSNILLLRAYGLPLYSRGRIGVGLAQRVGAVFARNRCNLIFAERARHRHGDRAGMSPEVRWAELEWRFCRAVANSLSMALIQRGLAVPSLRVFFNGDVRVGFFKGIERRWRTGSVVLEIAGRRFDSGRPPYVPSDDAESALEGVVGEVERAKLVSRARAVRDLRARRIYEIVNVGLLAYEELVRTDGSLRSSVEVELDALSTRISVPPLRSSS